MSECAGCGALWGDLPHGGVCVPCLAAHDAAAKRQRSTAAAAERAWYTVELPLLKHGLMLADDGGRVAVLRHHPVVPRGDIILRADGVPVATVDDFCAIEHAAALVGSASTIFLDVQRAPPGGYCVSPSVTRLREPYSCGAARGGRGPVAASASPLPRSPGGYGNYDHAASPALSRKSAGRGEEHQVSPGPSVDATSPAAIAAARRKVPDPRRRDRKRGESVPAVAVVAAALTAPQSPPVEAVARVAASVPRAAHEVPPWRRYTKRRFLFEADDRGDESPRAALSSPSSPPELPPKTAALLQNLEDVYRGGALRSKEYLNAVRNLAPRVLDAAVDVVAEVKDARRAARRARLDAKAASTKSSAAVPPPNLLDLYEEVVEPRQGEGVRAVGVGGGDGDGDLESHGRSARAKGAPAAVGADEEGMDVMDNVSPSPTVGSPVPFNRFRRSPTPRRRFCTAPGAVQASVAGVSPPPTLRLAGGVASPDDGGDDGAAGVDDGFALVGTADDGTGGCGTDGGFTDDGGASAQAPTEAAGEAADATDGEVSSPGDADHDGRAPAAPDASSDGVRGDVVGHSSDHASENGVVEVTFTDA